MSFPSIQTIVFYLVLAFFIAVGIAKGLEYLNKIKGGFKKNGKNIKRKRRNKTGTGNGETGESSD